MVHCVLFQIIDCVRMYPYVLFIHSKQWPCINSLALYSCMILKMVWGRYCFWQVEFSFKHMFSLPNIINHWLKCCCIQLMTHFKTDFQTSTYPRVILRKMTPHSEWCKIWSEFSDFLYIREWALIVFQFWILILLGCLHVCLDNLYPNKPTDLPFDLSWIWTLNG